MHFPRRVLLMAVLLAAVAAPSFAESGNGIIPNVVYGHKDGMGLLMHVFKPNGESNGAGVLFMVSGGWVSEYRPPAQLKFFLNPLIQEGFTVFAVQHGSSPKYKVPEAYADVKKALRHIRANAQDYGVDPERLGVYGFSAGGHLSLMLGTTGEDGNPEAEDELEKIPTHVKAVVAYFPPVDLRSIVGPSDRFPALDFDPELSESVSPILHVSPDDPPTLLIHGDKDDLVPVSASETMHEALQEKNVETDLIIIEGAGHGFRQPDHIKQASEALTEWFTKYLATD